MTEQELLQIIKKLEQSDEITWIEAKHNFADLVKIGETISALSNSASYQNEEYAYFIWGLEDKTWEVLGTTFDLKKKKQGNNDGQIWLNENLHRKAHWDEFEIRLYGKRIYGLKIKNCGKYPIQFQKIKWIRKGSNNQELSKYPEIERTIWNKKLDYDWSAEPCQGATIEDLDLEAVEMARVGYVEKQRKLKNVSQVEIVSKLKLHLKKDILKFLKYAKLLTNDSQITNGEIAYLEITFGAREIYSIPFQKSILQVISQIKIRSIELPTKFFGETTINNHFRDNYTLDILRELVANCVAHQDYSKRSRIKVFETINKFVEFENQGVSLYPKKDMNNFAKGEDIPSLYRNEFLAQAMVEIGLMEAKGTGYNKIFKYNTSEVYLPLPEIDWKRKDIFYVKLFGASLDNSFAKILSSKTELESEEILLLDQVQKTNKISKNAFEKLNRKKLIGGSPSQCYLGLDIVKLLDEEGNSKINEAEHFGNLIDKDYLIKLLSLKIEKQNCNRSDLEFIYHKMPSKFTYEQKHTKLSDLLAKTMSKKLNLIKNIGSRKNPIWTWIKNFNNCF